MVMRGMKEDTIARHLDPRGFPTLEESDPPLAGCSGGQVPDDLSEQGIQTGGHVNRARVPAVEQSVIWTVTNARFDDSACVLLNAKGEMMGTRISGPVSATLREIEGNQPGGRWAKILAVAPKVSVLVLPGRGKLTSRSYRLGRL